MFKNILQNREYNPIQQKSAEFVLSQSGEYLRPLEKKLSKQIDDRYVRTFFDLFIAILMFRNRPMSLLLSELGGWIAGFDRAPNGTKRISRLLRFKKWGHELIQDFFFDQGKQRMEKLQAADKTPLLLWDDSQVEKPESWFLGGLCSVMSSKSKRLTRIKPGYYNPPVKRVCVPGYKWTGINLTALGEIPSVFQMEWWTTRGVHKEQGSNIIYRMLKKIDDRIGRMALHVFDRGYASAKMVEWLTDFKQDFLIRWKSNHFMIDQNGEKKKIFNIAKSHRGKYRKTVWDKQRKKQKRVTIAWTAIKHPELTDNQLYLVIVRDKNNYNSPMYLVTNVKIENAADAWKMMHAYMKRWDIEQAFRCCKAELGCESPRLWFFKNTLKLLSILTLVYDFLLRMICNWKPWVQRLFQQWAYRTGNRYRQATIPIYRLRAAVSNVLLSLFFTQLAITRGYALSP
ncbi:MAG: transposase [Saprospiraceae bacterium]